MKVTSEEIGKWLAHDAADAVAPSSIPFHVEKVSGGCIIVPGLHRLAVKEMRRAFAAIVEGAIERGAFVLTTGEDVAAAGEAADLSAAPLGDVLPSPEDRANYPGLNPSKFARAPNYKWQHVAQRVVPRLLAPPSAALEPEGRGLRIFVPFTLGTYSGEGWTRTTPTEAADVFPELAAGADLPSSARAFGQSVCSALAKFFICLPENDSSDPDADGHDPLVTSVLTWLGLLDAAGDVPPFAYYIGGRTSADDYSNMEEWMPKLEGKDSEFLGLYISRIPVIPLIRAFFGETEGRTAPSLWSHHLQWPMATAENIWNGNDGAGRLRFNSLYFAASALALSRLAPFGLFLLDGNYYPSGANAPVSRLAAGIAHFALTLSCSYSITPVLDEDSNTWSGKVSVSYSTTYPQWGTAGSTADGSMDWSVSAPSVSSKTGFLTDKRVFDYDVEGVIKDGFLAGVTGVDGVISALEGRGFTGFKTRSPGDATKDWIFNEQEECTLVFAKFDFGIIETYLEEQEPAYYEYVTGGDAEVDSYEAAHGSVTLSARMPSDVPTLHGNADMTGLHDYPCKGAIDGGYAANGKLWSLWAGSVTGAEDAQTSPVYAIPAKAYTLQSGDAGVTDGDSFRTNHIDAARSAAEYAFPRLRAGDTRTYTNADGEEVTEPRNYPFSRDAIADLAESLYSAFPSRSQVEAAVTDLSMKDGGWERTLPENCAALVFVNADGSVRTVIAGSWARDEYFKVNNGVEGLLFPSSWSSLHVTETRTSGTFGLLLAQDFYPDLEHYDSWSANLKFGGCLGAFDWKWKAIKLE